MPAIQQHHKPSRSKDIVFQSMPPDTILLNLSTGYYFSTNRLGAEVWQRCDGDTETTAIIAALHDLFDVDLDTLTADVEAFLQQLLDEGLLHVEAKE